MVILIHPVNKDFQSQHLFSNGGTEDFLGQICWKNDFLIEHFTLPLLMLRLKVGRPFFFHELFFDTLFGPNACAFSTIRYC